MAEERAPLTQSTSSARQLHVLVVDDSAVVRQVFTALLSQERDMTVAVAADPLIAATRMARERPDVIVLDLAMPRMDGLTFLRKLMAEDPIPVVICSGLAGRGSREALRAMEQGAVAVVAKPRVGVKGFLHESAVMLMDTIRGAAQARLPRRRLPEPRHTADAVLERQVPQPAQPGPTTVIAVGASTGGTEALRTLLDGLPPECPPVLVVQHMPEGFTRAFAERLNASSRLAVAEAGHGDEVRAGRALLAPGNRHMLLRNTNGRSYVELSDGPLVSRHRPSVDVLFRSVAQAAGTSGVGVLLTGMGRDGASGLLEMKEAGASTLAQDEASCVVFGMPREAIELGAVGEVVALEQMAQAVLRATHQAGRVRLA